MQEDGAIRRGRVMVERNVGSAKIHLSRFNGKAQRRSEIHLSYFAILERSSA